ncbi:MAG: CAP domain-containing protein [Paracoccus sp. (in: a-proteobacteria)]
MLAGPALASGEDCDSNGPGQTVLTLARQTNETRAARGRPGLAIDAQLNLAAQHHACDLARRQVISHRDRQGREPLARVRTAGFPACFSAENLAQGTKSPGITVSAWQKSAGHARNQQNPRARSMGFGVARAVDGRLYWVGLYAARCGMERAEGGIRPFRW